MEKKRAVGSDLWESRVVAQINPGHIGFFLKLCKNCYCPAFD